jgi:hypothetical protein
MQNIPISIVIPSLGDKKVIKVIDFLNKDKNYKISEIILSVPKNKKNHLEHIISRYKNVKILSVNRRSQVYQRIQGFKAANENQILQLDDDIFINIKSIKILIKRIIQLDSRRCFAPIYKDFNGNFLHKKKNSILYKIHLIIMLLLFGSIKKINEMGSFDNALVYYGEFNSNILLKYLEVDWLLGGCIIHKKKNLILNNFFPFNGKSFCEDLIHSIKLKNKGIKLYVDRDAFVLCKQEDSINNFKQFKSFIFGLNLFINSQNYNYYNVVRKLYFFIFYQFIKIFIKKIKNI